MPSRVRLPFRPVAGALALFLFASACVAAWARAGDDPPGLDPRLSSFLEYVIKDAKILKKEKKDYASRKVPFEALLLALYTHAVEFDNTPDNSMALAQTGQYLEERRPELAPDLVDRMAAFYSVKENQTFMRGMFLDTVRGLVSEARARGAGEDSPAVEAAPPAASAARPTPAASATKLPPAMQRGVDQYLRELNRVRDSKERLSLERLFECADSLDDYLFGPDSTSSIEWFPDEVADSLREELPGINVAMDDYAYAELDSAWFHPFFEEHGLPADVAFMRIYAARELGDTWPGDCAHFGKGWFVNQHAAWRGFIARYPGHYVRYAADEDRDAIEDLTTRTCVCGDSLSYAAELQSFLKRFPKDPAAAQVRARLAGVRKGTAKVQYQCVGQGYR